VNARLSALALVLLFTACPEPTPTPDGGTLSPVLTSVTPSSGPVSGGTTVSVNGTNFVNGATVTFAGLPGVVTFESDRKLSVVTPAAATSTAIGPVTVAVTNPGGKSSALMGAFTYEGTTSTRTISEAVLQNPADASASGATATVAIVVSATVEVPTVTAGTGAGSGVRAQVGFSTTVGATPLSSDFTWVDAMYVGDADGASSGDKARDAYSGSVALPAPTTGTQLIYFVTARFSVDGGQNWTIADRDGAANGTATTQLAKVTVTRASVEWCKLGGQIVEAPPTVSLRGAATGPTIYGQVFKANVTTTTGAGTGIKGALGYGPAGSDPSTWTWVDATYNTDTGGGANDEFQAQLPNPGAGSYKFAFRFNHDDGPWSYCDADGLALDGFTEAQAGTLTVQDLGIDSCNLQFPDALTTWEGRASGLVYGRVYVQGLTEATGAATGIEGQLGYGTAGVAPSDASWSWTASSVFNGDVMGGGEEYRATLVGPPPASYVYAWRFRVNGGAWTYCDKDGSMNGVQTAQLGVLTAAPFDVTSCVLESANSAQTLLPNAMTQPFAMLVTVPTLTDAQGQGTPLPVEIGYGAAGSAPSTWTTWSTATYDSDSTAADRYTATLTAPATAGSYAVAFRARVGTKPYAYCDLDGSQNGFQQNQAGRVTVANALIQSCKLNTVSQFTMPSGNPLVVTARVMIPSVTANAGAAPNLRVQIGIGPQGDNASASTLWGWQEAAYAAEAAGSDEFSLTTWPAYTGMRAVSARASLDGLSWIYCDFDGSDVGGYTANQQYDVVLTPHTDLDYCNTQFPGVADGGTTIYGQVYEAGRTPDASTPFIAQLGIGAETQDPGFAWTWQPATFNTVSGNNNEYQSTLAYDAGVGLRYAFRYSLDGGVWCYGDFDGSQNGFSGGSNVGLITAP
jgi:hypothetical protein